MPCKREIENRLAPRSFAQFKVGPDFSETIIFNPIFDELGNVLRFSLRARTDRGLQYQDDGWVGFKRNYFSLVSSLELESSDYENFIYHQYFFNFGNENQKMEEIKRFEIGVQAVMINSSNTVTLIEHSAKRDSLSKKTALPIPVIASQLPDHDKVTDAINSISKSTGDLFLFDRREIITKNFTDNYNTDIISRVAKYDRLQFSQSTQKGEKFMLVVQLIGVLKDGSNVVLAVSKSPPLSILGRANNSFTFQPLKEEKEEEKIKKSNKITTSPKVFASQNRRTLTRNIKGERKKTSHIPQRRPLQAINSNSPMIHRSKVKHGTECSRISDSRAADSKSMVVRLKVKFPQPLPDPLFVSQDHIFSPGSIESTSENSKSVTFDSYGFDNSIGLPLPSLKSLTDKIHFESPYITFPSLRPIKSVESTQNIPSTFSGITCPEYYSLRIGPNQAFLGRQVDSSTSDFGFKAFDNLRSKIDTKIGQLMGPLSASRAFTRPSVIYPMLPYSSDLCNTSFSRHSSGRNMSGVEISGRS